MALTMEMRGEVLARLRGVLFRPRAAWQEIADERIDIVRFYLRYIMPLAAIPPLCKLIGWSLSGFIHPGLGLLAALLGYALDLAAFTFVVLVATRLAPPFQGEGDLEQALKLVAYAATPSWIGGVFRLVPLLGIVSLLLSLYSAYVLYLGVTPLLAVPEDSALGYTAALLVAALIMIALIGVVVGLVAGVGLSGMM